MLGSTSGGARQSGLTVEQRTRIENNRRTALERRRSGGAGRGVAPVSLHVRTILETVPGFQFPPSRDGVDSALPCAQFPRDNDLSDGVQFGRDFEDDSEEDDDVYDVGLTRMLPLLPWRLRRRRERKESISAGVSILRQTIEPSALRLERVFKLSVLCSRYYYPGPPPHFVPNVKFKYLDTVESTY